MKIYYSLSTNGNSFNITTINMWKLSLALVKKHYGASSSIELICDTNAKNILKDLPFDNVHVLLDNINYPTIWSLGKIYAYDFACSVGEPFLHLDADVFLWEPLPEILLNSPVFCQSKDRILGTSFYDVDKLNFYTHRAVPTDWYEQKGTMSYNLGIFGGTNISLIKEYCDYVLSMINNDIYKPLWEASPAIPFLENFNLSSTKSCLIEQGNFGIFCKNKNITPGLLFDTTTPPDDAESAIFTYKKYTHLVGKKNDSSIIERINQRVSVEPYDLLPRNVSVEEWN